MYEADPRKVKSGKEKAPEAPTDNTETAAAAFEKDKLAFKEKNAKLYTGCIWRRRTARMDFRALRLRSSCPSLRFGLRNSVTDVVLSLPGIELPR